MIKIEPNGPGILLSHEQLTTISRLAGKDSARVIDLEGSADIEVYVGDYYHEPYRHRVNYQGEVLTTEHDPNDSGDWVTADLADVTKHDKALQTVIDAAWSWRSELLEWIAPASDNFDDPESAESQRAYADDIDEAIGVLSNGNIN